MKKTARKTINLIGAGMISLLSDITGFCPWYKALALIYVGEMWAVICLSINLLREGKELIIK